MQWLKRYDLKAFLSQKNYDVRISGNARWIDQKCTPDVLTIVADCIINFLEEKKDKNMVFTSMDIWRSSYARDNVLSIFKKPDPDNKKAKNEYDKFFQQPMELLSYAGILQKAKKGSKNFYQVNEYDLLYFLSLREKNSLDFLICYIERVLLDSGLLSHFNEFFEKQDTDSYFEVKRVFTDFTIRYTKIKNKLECWRIFIKIINPLAYDKNKQGTERGRISKFKITYDMLMYNRENFRDINVNKPKDKTRKEYFGGAAVASSVRTYIRYLTQKAKRVVKEYNEAFNNGFNEIDNGKEIKDAAVNIHHIFMESSFPSISYYLENLIALTPNQHLIEAHPNGNTQEVDKKYQCLCLISKLRTIEDSYANDRDIYDFNKFIKVLNIGFNTDDFSDISFKDFAALNLKLNLMYNNLS